MRQLQHTAARNSPSLLLLLLTNGLKAMRPALRPTAADGAGSSSGSAAAALMLPTT